MFRVLDVHRIYGCLTAVKCPAGLGDCLVQVRRVEFGREQPLVVSCCFLVLLDSRGVP